MLRESKQRCYTFDGVHKKTLTTESNYEENIYLTTSIISYI